MLGSKLKDAKRKKEEKEREAVETAEVVEDWEEEVRREEEMEKGTVAKKVHEILGTRNNGSASVEQTPYAWDDGTAATGVEPRFHEEAGLGLDRARDTVELGSESEARDNVPAPASSAAALTGTAQSAAPKPEPSSAEK